MSGGSYDYAFAKIENECFGRMHDKELNRMVVDFAKLLHDLEWWISGDHGEEVYRQTVKEFKEKWMKGERRKEILEEIINEECEKLKNDLKTML